MTLTDSTASCGPSSVSYSNGVVNGHYSALLHDFLQLIVLQTLDGLHGQGQITELYNHFQIQLHVIAVTHNSGIINGHYSSISTASVNPLGHCSHLSHGSYGSHGSHGIHVLHGSY